MQTISTCPRRADYPCRADFDTAAYARASKDDPDSSTIENQIELIREYAKNLPDVRIVSVREDNGFSGVDFIRPDFNKMMKDIEDSKINCVIVKDLSRLGRNYIEVGELMEEVFPKYNVRLIAINDNYDSLNPRTDADEIIIPFKNLINEQYLRDSSVKIRSGLNIKRKNGNFVSAFAPYGYKRDDNDKHSLVIDEHAAEVVRSIFRLKIEGMSQQKIAEWLDEIGEPSPAEYKKRETNYKAQFQTNVRASWSAVAIGRILKNPAYIGVLVQGKQTTPSYKVKRRVDKPEDEWHIIEDNHEPIISKRDFEIVNGLLGQDTRTAPKQNTVYPLSGMVYCGDCGNNMIRTKSDGKHYYICASSRGKEKCCSSHCIQNDKLERAVTEAVTRQIAFALEIEKSLSYIKSLPSQQRNIVNLSAQITDREEEIKSCERYKRSLYEDYKSGIISKEDYIEFGKDYTARITELKQAVLRLHNEAELLLGNDSSALEWLTHFTQYRNIPDFNRQFAVNLIERIDVFTRKRINIHLRYGDCLESAYEIIKGIIKEEAGCSVNGENEPKTA
ncbi:MAG: recombinase family protein [Oscillospiraceae bacterium]|nr:recombinase family protein [Oscillospiraceae bacterium]